MALTPEQADEFKKQILEQIKSLPEEQRAQASEQIESMSEQELEEFIVKNNMLQKEKASTCIFCDIVQGKVKSHKIGENKKALAILDISPLSKGHSLILSREHKKLPSSAFALANKIAKKIKKKLKAEEMKIENASIMGHQIIQVIPLYKNEKLEKKQASDSELLELQSKLQFKPRTKREKKQLKEIKLEQAPRRFP